ncbi:MAG: hypothetical protein ACFUZC_20900 [Chthoniobacteraceae bacterium]
MKHCLAVLLLAAGAVNAAELLTEQDFESVRPYLPGWGAGYKQTYKPATAWKIPFLIALDESDAHSGAKAVKIAYVAEAAPGEKIFHSPGIAFAGEARRVRIRFYYRLTGIPAGALYFSPMEINGQTKGKRLLSKISLNPTEEWRPVEYEGKLNAEAGQVQLIWTNTSDKVPGALWIDDVSVDLL